MKSQKKQMPLFFLPCPEASSVLVLSGPLSRPQMLRLLSGDVHDFDILFCPCQLQLSQLERQNH